MNNIMKYIGKKEVLAERMNELQAVELGYAKPNKDNHEWREGYHVIYPDGYHSWSPLVEFHLAYEVAETFIDRMKIELKELDGRIHKLEKFIEDQNKTHPALNWEDKALLYAQLNAMASYRSTLIIRLAKIEEQNYNCCCEPCSEI